MSFIITAKRDERLVVILIVPAMRVGNLPGEPVASNYGLLSMNSGLLWGIVAYYFRLLGFPGSVFLPSPNLLPCLALVRAPPDA